MNLHMWKMSGTLLRKGILPTVLMCLTIALAAQSVYAAVPSHATRLSLSTSATQTSVAPVSAPAPCPTPKPYNPKATHCSKVIRATGSPTGETSRGKTSVSYCNGQTYVAWTGVDDRINIGWDYISAPGFFGHKQTFDDWTYEDTNTNPTTLTSPELVCWKAASGQYSDMTRLWIVFTGTDRKLYYGFLQEGNPKIQVHLTIPGQSSVYSPAAATSITGALWVAWRGNTNKYLYIEQTPDGASWYNQQGWTSQTADGGPGFNEYCTTALGCKLWIVWIGTDTPTHHIYVGYYDELNTRTFTFVKGLADYSGLNDDLTLTSFGSTLYLPYAGVDGLFRPNVDISSDGRGVVWNNQQDLSDDQCIWGVGGDVLPGGHLWVAWTRYGDNQIFIQQWN